LSPKANLSIQTILLITQLNARVRQLNGTSVTQTIIQPQREDPISDILREGEAQDHLGLLIWCYSRHHIYGETLTLLSPFSSPCGPLNDSLSAACPSQEEGTEENETFHRRLLQEWHGSKMESES